LLGLVPIPGSGAQGQQVVRSVHGAKAHVLAPGWEAGGWYFYLARWFYNCKIFETFLKIYLKHFFN
jgi:hypothetical protein